MQWRESWLTWPVNIAKETKIKKLWKIMLPILGVRNALLRKYRWKCLMVVNFRFPSSKGWKIRKWSFHPEIASNVFRSHFTGEIWKRSNRCCNCHFGFVFEKNSGRSRDYFDFIRYFRKASFLKCFSFIRNRNGPAFSNSSGLKNVFEKLRRLRDALVWSVGRRCVNSL